MTGRMSKRNVIVHLVWLVITLGTFVTGSQLARAIRGTDKSESGGVTIPPSAGKRDVAGQADAGQTERYVPLPGRAGGKPESLPSTPDTQKSDASVERTRKLQSARRTMAREASEALRRRGPLGKKQIHALVLQAVKAPSALGRRQAFDRILEEMGSATFTREQAFTMRSWASSYEGWRKR